MKRSILIVAGLIATAVSGAAAADDPIQGITATRGDGSPLAGAKFVVLDVDGDCSAEPSAMHPGQTSVVEEDGSQTYLFKSDGLNEVQNIANGMTDSLGKASFTYPPGSWDPDPGDGSRPDLVVVVYQLEKGISRIVGESSVSRDASGAATFLVTAGSLSSLPQDQAQSPAVAAYAAGIAKLDFLALDAAMVTLARGPKTGAGWQTNYQTVKSRAEMIAGILKQTYPGQDPATANLARALSDSFSSYIAAVQRIADLWKKGEVKLSDYRGAFRCWRLQQMLLFKLRFCQAGGTMPAVCTASPEQAVSAPGLAMDKAIIGSASGAMAYKAIGGSVSTPGLGLPDD